MQNGRDNHNEKVVFLSQEEYNRLTTLEEVNRDQYIEITYLKQELAELRRMIFASKSERFIPTDSGQLSLGLDVEQKEVEKQETEEITYKRHKPKKKAPVRLPLPSHLYREKIIIEPEEDVFRGKKIGEEITEILEFTRGRFYVKQYVRSRYVLPEEDKIVIGDLPSLPIPKGNAGPGLLAHLLISKFMDHLPFYRQVQMFKREDITIAESTISGWFAATCRLLEPLYEHLKEKVRQSEYLMADETPIPVLTKDKPGSTHKGFHWVYYSPPDKLVCFDYRKGRGRDGPREFLDGFQGTLQSDGYNAYNEFENKKGITLLACLAHARRYPYLKQIKSCFPVLLINLLLAIILCKTAFDNSYARFIKKYLSSLSVSHDGFPISLSMMLREAFSSDSLFCFESALA
jgi:transposase